jgi:hypothetical protein
MRNTFIVIVAVVAIITNSSCKKMATSYSVNCTFTERVTGIRVANESVSVGYVFYDIMGSPNFSLLDHGSTDSDGHIHFDISASEVPGDDSIMLMLEANGWRCDQGFFVSVASNNENEIENYREVYPKSILKVKLTNSGFTSPADSVILYGGCVSPCITTVVGNLADTVLYTSIEGDLTTVFTLVVHSGTTDNTYYQSLFVSATDTSELVMNY